MAMHDHPAANGVILLRSTLALGSNFLPLTINTEPVAVATAVVVALLQIVLDTFFGSEDVVFVVFRWLP
jgi:hypothetical protein